MRYAGGRRTRLPWPGTSEGPAGGGIAEVGRVLLGCAPNRVHHQGGVTYMTRAVPSGGAYYPGELYLSWPGSAALRAGLYHYDAVHHELVELAGAEPMTGAAPVYLLACRVWKNSAKYEAMGYRLGCLDIGALAGQLLVLGAGQGRLELFFDQDLVDGALALDSTLVSVYAALPALSGERLRTRWVATGARNRPGPPGGIRADQELAVAADPDVRDMHRRAGLAVTPPPLQAALPPQAAVPPRGAVALPRTAPVDLPAEAFDRGSAAAFLPRAIALDQLAAVLARASGDVPSDVVEATGREAGLSLYCVANRVTGCKPGAYRYDPSAHALRPCGAAEAPALLAAAMELRSELAPIGAVHVFVTGPLADGGRSIGARWYRALYLLAGVVVQRLCLAAPAAGIGARPILGFDPAAVDALLAVPSGHNALIQVVLGVPGTGHGSLELGLR